MYRYQVTAEGILFTNGYIHTLELQARIYGVINTMIVQRVGTNDSEGAAVGKEGENGRSPPSHW